MLEKDQSLNHLPTMQERAARHFGLTDNPLEAGYILSDGTLLKLDGDHKLIGHAFPSEIRMHSRALFLTTGAIRIRIRQRGSSRSMIEFSKIPNEEQKKTLVRVFTGVQNVDIESTHYERTQHDEEGVLFVKCPVFSKAEFEKLILRAIRLQAQEQMTRRVIRT